MTQINLLNIQIKSDIHQHVYENIEKYVPRESIGTQQDHLLVEEKLSILIAFFPHQYFKVSKENT